MQSTNVLDWDGKLVGTYLRTVETRDGAMLLIEREAQLGGGTIVVPMRSIEEPVTAWHLAYSELSIREAPPYSANVDLHAYFEYWKRLGSDDFNRSMGEFLPSGSGPVQTDAEVPDRLLWEAVCARLRGTDGVFSHLITVSVNRSTVLLEGFQNDTIARLAAAQAAAGVPGVKEIVNMLVIRTLV